MASVTSTPDGRPPAAAPTHPDEPEANIQEIREEIERTRAEMGQTIDAVQERLDPAAVKQQVKEEVAEQVAHVTEHATATIREATVDRAEQVLRQAEAAARWAQQQTGPAVTRTQQQVQSAASRLRGTVLGAAQEVRTRAVHMARRVPGGGRGGVGALATAGAAVLLLWYLRRGRRTCA